MKKRSTLLMVVSIIIIIFSVISIISSAWSLANKSQIDEMMANIGMDSISVAMYIVSLFMSLIQLLAGIFGLVYRSKAQVLVIGIIYVGSILVNFIYAVVSSGFSPLLTLNLILPVLYMWGWYQSN